MKMNRRDTIAACLMFALAGAGILATSHGYAWAALLAIALITAGVLTLITRTGDTDPGGDQPPER